MQSVYLDELNDATESRSLGVELIRLTIVSADEAVELARSLLSRVPEQVSPDLSERAIIDVITTIMVYQLATRSREEIEAMLGLNLEEPRALREERERGEARGLEQGRQEEARSLIMRLLTRRFGVMSPERIAQIDRLPLVQLEELGEALLDFTTVVDLDAWLVETLTP